jgi:RNA polymerase sigma-70 factor (TIGR02960 family)
MSVTLSQVRRISLLAGVYTLMGVPASQARSERSDAELTLVERARGRDGRAFEELVAPYRRELETHCYRILGSLTDAEDALQESLTAAWQGLESYRGAASIRTWLYRITTNRCLNITRSARRRQARDPSVLGVEPPEPTQRWEIVWLEPYPDSRLEDFADTQADPEAHHERREAISLAFVAALQLLPPQPRATLILRDVLGFSARETAAMLDMTAHAVNSALRRARAMLARELPDSQQSLAISNTPEERMLLDCLVRAWEDGDVHSLVALMTEDVWLRMPPMPFEYQGREAAARFFSTVVFRKGRRFRLHSTCANGQPAFGLYLYSHDGRSAEASGLVVLSLSSNGISAMTHFDKELLWRFGLPRSITLPSHLRDGGPK